MAPSDRARQVMTAARTDPAAAHRLAGWYHGGEEGLHQSLELAFRWELRAAEGGHLEAQGYWAARTLMARAWRLTMRRRRRGLRGLLDEATDRLSTTSVGPTTRRQTAWSRTTSWRPSGTRERPTKATRVLW